MNTLTDDPVCRSLLDAFVALHAIEAADIEAMTDPHVVAAVITQAERVIGLAHVLKIRALCGLGETLRP